MMMKMLEAGGLTPLIDNIRKADGDNPKGYYEFEKVKRLDKNENKSWLYDAKGKVIKVISQLLMSLPEQHFYKVIFIKRKMQEILASQKLMLTRRGAPAENISDEEMGKLFEKHLDKIESWLEKQPNFEVLYVTYHEIINNSLEYSEKINFFLGGSLNIESMVKAVDNTLYRQRV